MTWLPEHIQRLLDTALVGELTVVRADGRPITYPIIPLPVEGRLYMTASVLFSRKLEHLRANPRVSLSITDPASVDGAPDRVTLQGDAALIEDDPHVDWERVLPVWLRKEPSIGAFLKQRVALPLFFERSLVEIRPRRALYWPDGRTDASPEVFVAPAVETAEAA